MTTTTAQSNGKAMMRTAPKTDEHTLAATGAGGLRLVSFSDFQTFAKAARASGLIPDLKSEAEAVIRLQYGAELGLAPMTSLLSIFSVKGRPAMSAALLAARIRQSGRYSYDVDELTNTRARLTFTENGRPIGKSEFTLDDAKTAQVAGGDNWRKYPRNMLFARALSNGARWFCPDLFFGAVYTAEELRAGFDTDDMVIDAAIVEDTKGALEESGVAHEEPAPVSDDEVRLLVRDIGDSKSRDEALAIAERFRGREVDKEYRCAISDALAAKWPKNGKPAPARRAEKPPPKSEPTVAVLSSMASAYVALLDAATNAEQLWAVMDRQKAHVESLAVDEQAMLGAYEQLRLAQCKDGEDVPLTDAEHGEDFTARCNRLLALLGRQPLPATTGEVLP